MNNSREKLLKLSMANYDKNKGESYDYIGKFVNGFAVVGINMKSSLSASRFNFIDEKGHIVSKQWFDYCSDFNNGFAPVKLNDKWNLIDNQGKYISEQWFDPISFFSLTLLLFC